MFSQRELYITCQRTVCQFSFPIPLLKYTLYRKSVSFALKKNKTQTLIPGNVCDFKSQIYLNQIIAPVEKGTYQNGYDSFDQVCVAMQSPFFLFIFSSHLHYLHRKEEIQYHIVGRRLRFHHVSF